MKIEPFVNLSILSNGDLLVELDEEARQEVEEISQNENSNADSKLWEVLEYWLCNSEWEFLSNVETGDLFDGPILCFQCTYDDKDNLVDMTGKYGYGDYALYDPVEKLLEDGKLVFMKAEEWNWKEDVA